MRNTLKHFGQEIVKIAKVEVAGPNPVSRSKEIKGLANKLTPFSLGMPPFVYPFIQQQSSPVTKHQ